MKILNPRFTEILQLIQVDNGFVVRERFDDRLLKGSSNLYKVDNQFNFSWEITTRDKGDGFPNPVVIDGENLKVYSWNCVEIVFNPQTGIIVRENLVRF